MTKILNTEDLVLKHLIYFYDIGHKINLNVIVLVICLFAFADMAQIVILLILKLGYDIFSYIFLLFFIKISKIFYFINTVYISEGRGLEV